MPRVGRDALQSGDHDVLRNARACEDFLRRAHRCNCSRSSSVTIDPAFGRGTEFRKFLTEIDQQVPEDLDVHLVCDNYGTHTHPSCRHTTSTNVSDQYT